MRNNTESATKSIINKLKELNKEKGLNLTFIGFKNGIWEGKETISIIKCNIHNIIIETQYKFVVYKKTKDIMVCPECLKQKVGKVHKKLLSREDAIFAIQTKINDLKPERDLEFLGFVDDTNDDISVSSTIKIKCKKHNTVKIMQITKFLNSKLGGCTHCQGDEANHPNMLSNRQIYDKLVNKYGDYYDFSPILKEEELGAMSGRRAITFICPIHGKRSMNISSLLGKNTNNIPCSECAKDYYRKLSKEDCIKEIQEAINWRKETLSFDYEFLGFDGEYISKAKTKAIIKCKKHNNIFKVKPADFINGKIITGCIDCGTQQFKYENICYSILKDLGLNVIRQYSIKCFDDILNKSRTLNVDFYLPDLNIIIEYDGAQHFMYNSRFHKNIEDYKDQIRRDELKNTYCLINNISLLRVTYRDNKRLKKVIATFINTGLNLAAKILPAEAPIQINSE